MEFPFDCRSKVIVSGKLVPEAGAILPWKAAAYTPGEFTVKLPLPGVWEMLVPAVTEFRSNTSGWLLDPGAAGVE